MSNALIARPFEFFERQSRLPIGGIELLGATPRVPLRLEGRQQASNLLEADAIGPLVWPGIGRHLDAAAGHHIGNDFCDLAHAIVVVGGADVERLIEDRLFGRIERSNKRAGDVLDMRDRPPGRSIRLEIDEAAGDGKGLRLLSTMSKRMPGETP